MRVLKINQLLSKKFKVLVFSGLTLSGCREVLGRFPPGTLFAIPVWDTAIVFKDESELHRVRKKLKNLKPPRPFALIAFIPKRG